MLPYIRGRFSHFETASKDTKDTKEERFNLGPIHSENLRVLCVLCGLRFVFPGGGLKT